MAESGAPSTPTALRILHITEAPGGGVLSYLEEVIAYQSRAEAVGEVLVLGPDVNAPPLRGAAGPRATIRAFPRSQGTRSSIGALLGIAAMSRRAMRELRPDVLNVHSTFAGVLARLAVLTLRTRPVVVYCPHGWAFARGGALRPMVVAVERLLAAVTDRIVCVSRAEEAEGIAAGIPAARLSVVRNGIAAAPPEPPAREAPRTGPLRILFVGRFDRQKGFDVFLDIMWRLGESAEGFAVGDFLVGQADDSLAMPDNVTLLGWRSRADVQLLYRQADLLLMPSRWEGLPLVALEAMRSGLPIFSTRAGGLEEVVEDGVTGRFFDIDDPDAAAAAIRGTSRARLADYAERGRLRFQDRFTSERMNREILEVYAELLGMRRGTWPAAPGLARSGA